MVSQKVIEQLYKRYSSHPKDISVYLNRLRESMDILAALHKLELNDTDIVIGALDEDNPFRVIPIDRIYGIESFDRNIAIILRTCVLFLNKENSNINVHIKPHKISLWMRIKSFFFR